MGHIQSLSPSLLAYCFRLAASEEQSAYKETISAILLSSSRAKRWPAFFPTSPWSIGQVSSSWRRLVHDSPLMWTIGYFEARESQKGPIPQQTQEALRKTLELSGSAPLDVYLVLDWRSPDPSKSGVVEYFLEELLETCGRWSSLTASIVSYCGVHQVLLTSKRGCFSILGHLQLVRARAADTHHDLDFLPRLLIGNNLRWDNLSSFSSSSEDCCLRVLEHSSCLKTLTLLSPVQSVSIEKSATRRICGTLQHLIVDSSASEHFLQSYWYPSLQSFTQIGSYPSAKDKFRQTQFEFLWDVLTARKNHALRLKMLRLRLDDAKENINHIFPWKEFFYYRVTNLQVLHLTVRQDSQCHSREEDQVKQVCMLLCPASTPPLLPRLHTVGVSLCHERVDCVHHPQAPNTLQMLYQIVCTRSSLPFANVVRIAPLRHFLLRADFSLEAFVDQFRPKFDLIAQANPSLKISISCGTVE